LRYFYLNVEKNTSLGTARYVRTRQILQLFFHNLIAVQLNSIHCKVNVYVVELLQYFNASNENLAGRIVAINGYPLCAKASTVTHFFCIIEMF